MMIAQIISFNCILKNLTGHLISSTYNKDVLTSINNEQAMLIGLAKGLQGLSKGEKRKICLSAEEAYGFYDPKKIVYYPRKKLSKDIRIGETVKIVGKSGVSRVYKIIDLHSDIVSLDGNHPLAGQDLIFEIETLEARNATHEEVAAACNDMSVQLLH
ncbi:MAG: peptidylprolyl isomerase [Pseudobdellovibrio sp.]